MLKRIRVLLAIIAILAITLLFLDFTGFALHWWGWLAKIQFMPALLSLNVVALLLLIVATILFGRIYCSIICPLGILQDVVIHVRGWVGKKRKRRNRFHYSLPITWLRLSVLVLFAIFIILGVSNIVMTVFASFIEPYSAYGRIASSLFLPIYKAGNNLLADYAESTGSYAFYHVDLLFSLPNLIVALVTLFVVGILSWVGGRTYCNTICPVGTILGYISKYSLLKPVIDTSKCNGCTKCARNCKASCIDDKNHKIDYTRCVVCMDCLNNCSTHAISYSWVKNGRKDKKGKTDLDNKIDANRRDFLSVGAIVVGATVAKAANKAVTKIIEKEKPQRATRIVPAGAQSISNLTRHCTACQLCITACPNDVLRPSTELATFMQPMVEYEKGYCRPECVACSNACPVGAFHPITVAEKSAIQVGHAVVRLTACLSITQNINCGNCARHCPVGAIKMVQQDPYDENSPLMPIVNEERCIGCGACENLCPVRPLSAIYVEGHEIHRII